MVSSELPLASTSEGIFSAHTHFRREVPVLKVQSALCPILLRNCRRSGTFFWLSSVRKNETKAHLLDAEVLCRQITQAYLRNKTTWMKLTDPAAQVHAVKKNVSIAEGKVLARAQSLLSKVPPKETPRCLSAAIKKEAHVPVHTGISLTPKMLRRGC